jgi:hypothetical protein
MNGLTAIQRTHYQVLDVRELIQLARLPRGEPITRRGQLVHQVVENVQCDQCHSGHSSNPPLMAPAAHIVARAAVQGAAQAAPHTRCAPQVSAASGRAKRALVQNPTTYSAAGSVRRHPSKIDARSPGFDLINLLLGLAGRTGPPADPAALVRR